MLGALKHIFLKKHLKACDQLPLFLTFPVKECILLPAQHFSCSWAAAGNIINTFLIKDVFFYPPTSQPLLISLIMACLLCRL